jgi:magnesium transporter
VTDREPTPRPTASPGDPQTAGPTAATVSTAVPPKCATRTRSYRHGKVVAEGFPAEDISEVLGDDEECVVWLDLYDPDEDDLQIVTAEFGLHPLAVEDAIHDHQRPKVDRYRSHLFVNVYAVGIDSERCTARTSEISMFVTPRALITVRKSDFDVDSLIAHWDIDQHLAQDNSVSFLLYGLLDAVIDGHYQAVEALEDLAEDLEDHLFQPRPEVDIRRRGFELRRASATLRRVVEPMRDVVGRLMRSDLGLVTEPLAPYYQDVADHVQRTIESVDSTRDLLASILDANLTEQSNQLNEITKKLASWAAIIAVPTAVTGFYGQNVPYPGFGTHAGFAVSVVIMVVLAAGLYVLLRRQRWL